MPNTNNSPNMLLPVPAVGVDPGPQWATDLNSCLQLVDQHNHSPGQGVQIGVDGITINADLPIAGNNITTIRTARFNSQSAALTLPADLACAYVVGNDLYFNDGAGNNIRMTQNGAISGTAGSISGLTGTASASYVGASSTFVFQSATNTPGNIDGASFVLRNLIASSHGLTLAPPSSMPSNYTITLPALPASNASLLIDTSGTITANTSAYASSLPASDQINNLGIFASVATNALTVAIKQADGSSDPTADSPVQIAFRNSTITSGASVARILSSAVTAVIPSGASFGNLSGVAGFIYVYALDNAGSVELAFSSQRIWDESALQSTTILNGSSTSPNVLYSATARSSKAIRLIGRLTVNEAVAGVYGSAPSQLSVAPIADSIQSPNSSVYVDGAQGSGLVDGTVRGYLNIRENVGSAITYAFTANNASTFTINERGWYGVTASDVPTTSASLGITLNGSQLSASITTMTWAQGRRVSIDTSSSSNTISVCTQMYCVPGDIIRIQTSGGNPMIGTDEPQVSAHVQKIG